ncbi:MAG: transporter, partial [Myxococcales bacterium]|nr:transporter [Myxococcales bacterium]
MALVGEAAAQDIQGWHPAAGTWNYFSVDGSAVANTGEFVPALYFNYGRNPLVRRNANGDVVDKIIENLTTFDLMLTVGITERVEIAVDIPFSYSVGSEAVPIDDGAGLGDLRILPKFVLISSKQANGFGLALASPMSFPTGNNDSGSSSRNFVFNPRLVLEYRASTWSIAANGGYRVRPSDGETLPPLTVGNGVTYGGGFSANLGTPAVAAVAEVFGTQFEDVPADKGGANPLEALLGLRFHSTDKGLSAVLAGGFGLVNAFGAPELRVIGGLAWSSDSLGEDRVVIAGGTAGIDDGDDDGDGVRNFTDACPKEKEDRDGFQDADGCPDIDNDLDGIADVDDRCPVNAEDMDGFEDDDGCPEIDNDKDGIADQLDRCPMEPETKNGHRDDDGCPDGGLIVVEQGRIRILKKIYFDTNKDTIKPISFGVLDQVAEVLQYNKNIGKIRIEGHT